MGGLLFSLVAFGLVYGAATAGLALQRRLPESHRDPPSKESVQLVMGLIATMAALVLGLLIASSHAFFETQQEEVQKLAGDVILLDAALAHYGPDTRALRDTLREDVLAATQRMSPEEGIGSAALTANEGAGGKPRLLEDLQALEPKTNGQRFDQTKALDLMSRIAATRLLMHEQATSSVPAALMVVMLIWLMLLFLGFGLYAPDNSTVRAALGLGALSVAGALFLILDMSHPYRGLIHVSAAPIHNVLEQIGR